MVIVKYVEPETGENLPYRLQNLAVKFFDMSVNVYRSTSRNILEDRGGSSSASLCESHVSQCRIRNVHVSVASVFSQQLWRTQCQLHMEKPIITAFMS